MKQLQKIENLSETSKKIISEHMVRKSTNQKTNFINFLKNELKDTNLSFTVEKYDNNDKNRNIIIGDFKNAKYVYTAHYDTCATLGAISNFVTPTNFFVFILIQIAITLLLLIPCFAIGFLLQYLLSPYGFGLLGFELGYFSILILVIYLMRYGVPNKNNFNDNTSGVITLIEMIKNNKGNNNICFIFFDNEEKGLLGSKAFVKRHSQDKLNEKTIINFDCVSDGDNLLFIHKNINDNLINYLKNYQTNKNKKMVLVPSKKAIYLSDHRKFPNNIGVGAFNYKKFFKYYLGKIHTKRDIIFDEDNINLLVDIFINLPTDC